jgi:diguanylate cyclase (GGDEF)-like protein
MKILIADDDSSALELLATLVTQWGFQPVLAADGEEAWTILTGPDSPRLAMLDWMMPGVEGDEICRRVREKEKDDDTYTYLILLTAKVSTDHIVVGLEAGADDFIAKPVDQQELRVRVRAGQRSAQLHAELQRAKHDLWVLSRTDPLTGVFNRRAILSQLGSELDRTRRSGKQVSIGLLDIDHFKEVNDRFGHIAGDEVLRVCVKRIEGATRSYDFLGRMGGEEFLLVFPETNGVEALTVCNRIREAVAEEPVTLQGATISITVSQGLVTSSGQETVDDLIEKADRAMYRAKEKGRNRAEHADPKVGGEIEAANEG